MKREITRDALARIDRCRTLADTLTLAQQQLVEQVGAELGIEDWDAEKWSALERDVRAGGRRSTDEFLESLGVAVAETPIDGT